MYRTGRLIAGGLIALSLCFPLCGAAQDTQAAREVAVDRYLKAVPMQKVTDEMLLGIAKAIPPARQEQFIRDMRSVIQIEVMVNISRRAMLKTFTADELNALADFYASPNGASAMSKMGPYMAEVMPELMQEIRRAVDELKDRHQSAQK
jgi:hypothetical protein